MVAERPAPVTAIIPHASPGDGRAAGDAAARIGNTTPLPTIGAFPAMTTSGDPDRATVNVFSAQVQGMATCGVVKSSFTGAGLGAGATAKLKVAAGPSTICPPPKVTAPVTVRVALAKGMPAKPGVEANG